MKSRMSLVSNSSTSSFIILGYDISKCPDTISKIYDMVGEDCDNWYDITDKLQEITGIDNLCFRDGGGEAGLKEGEQILGILVTEVNNDGGDEMNARISLPEATKQLGIIREKFDFFSSDPKLIAGTRMS